MAADRVDAATPLRTKVADRPADRPRFTHSSEQLREFMLPAMAIEGLSLEVALQKLRTSYEEACRKTGETPLPLTFLILPPGASRKLTFHLPPGNFNTSVQLLATLSGMKATRNGREYRFEPLGDARKQIDREIRVSPDFNAALNDMAGFTSTTDPGPAGVPKSVSECLAALGLALDPSTQISLDAAGKLTLETTSAADAAMISELAKSLNDQPRTQIKLASKVVEISAGVDWAPPDHSQMTDAEVQILMRDMAQRKGTNLMTLPSTVSRNGQNAGIEMTKEFIYPTDTTYQTFETRHVGKSLYFQGNLIGFGQELSMDYKDTTVEMNASTGKPIFKTHTSVADTGFSKDGGTRFIVQTKADGSRTLLFFHSTLIDPTGRPLR